MPDLVQETIGLIHALSGEQASEGITIPSDPFKEKRKALLDKEIFFIQEILASPDHRVYVCPWIPKRYGNEADYVLEISDGLVDIKLYYRPDHGRHLYQNIAAAFSNCMAVWNSLPVTCSNTHMRVRTGCFNYKGVPYSISEEKSVGNRVFNIDLHSRFNMDQLSFLTHDLVIKIGEA